jgi:hypothetical protein
MFDATTDSVDRTLRDAGNALLDRYGQWRAKRYDPASTIVIACTGRGGSTWLAQTIASARGHHILWEQLHWKSNPDAETVGLGRPRYIPCGEDAPNERDFVRSILRGETLSRAINSQRYFRPYDLLRLRAYVAKFVTANMMLPWLVDTFGTRAVFMIRHPCAVVSSQLVHGEWDDVDGEFCRHDRLFDEHPHLRPLHERLDTHEEVLAFNWAVQNLVPLSAPSPQPWLTTTYEDLVTGGVQEAERIFDYLGEPVPEDVRDQLHTPSATTVQQSNVRKGKSRLTGWRDRLSPSQIDRILSTVHEAGVTVYSDDLFPDPSKLPTD